MQKNSDTATDIANLMATSSQMAQKWSTSKMDASSYDLENGSATTKERFLDSDIGNQQKEFGLILGLQAPVERDVLIAAIQNDSYATNLLITREFPQFLNQLLQNPPRNDNDDVPLSEILQRGIESLWRWSKAGFTTVNTAVLQRRLEACGTCPHLSAAPETRKLLYALVGTAAATRSVCKLCGCPVSRKANMADEACPDSHPDQDGVTRWGEPIEHG